MIGYLLTSMSAAQSGRYIPAGLIAMAEKDQQEQEQKTMKAKLSSKIKEVKTQIKEKELEGKEDNSGTQVFAEVADQTFQADQMEIGIDAAASRSQDAMSTALLNSPRSSPLNLLNRLA